jgi:predicted methyltransferase
MKRPKPVSDLLIDSHDYLRLSKYADHLEKKITRLEHSVNKRADERDEFRRLSDQQLIEIMNLKEDIRHRDKLIKELRVKAKEKLVCPNCDGEGFSGKGTNEILPCLSCFGSGKMVD